MGLNNDPRRKTIYFVLLFLAAFTVLRCSQALTESLSASNFSSHSRVAHSE